MKISENFNVEEFIYSKEANIKVSITTFQFFLLKNLVNNILQPTRNFYGSSLIINSGVRNKKIMDVLKAKGYPVSNNTDHSFGDPEVNPYGTGAVDFTVKNTKDLFKIYEWIQNNIDLKLIGQLIIYLKKDSKGNNVYDFIHVSNSPYVFSLALEEQRNKEKFLMRVDGKYVSANNDFLKNLA